MRDHEFNAHRVKTEKLVGYGDGVEVEEALTASEGVVLKATAVSGVTTLLSDSNGDALLATGTTVPTDTATGFAKGCLFIDTNVATGTTGLNCNKGTNTSCVFTAVTQA
jgi:hypothetical protein